ncbi:MAG: hypothetical protein LH468_13620 [Nocardioides sp.]|nr:hypothetical protein [Nocardioides sp.]
MKLTALAGLALVAGLVSGCGGGGGGGGAATDASEKEFCDSFTEFAASLQSADPEDTAAQIAAVKEAVGSLEEIGTPESISSEGREGFELFTGLVGDLDDDVSEDELNAIGEDLSDADDEKLTAFETYASQTCGSPAEDSPSQGAN